MLMFEKNFKITACFGRKCTSLRICLNQIFDIFLLNFDKDFRSYFVRVVENMSGEISATNGVKLCTIQIHPSST